LNVLEEENKKLRKECEENDYLVEDNARWMKKCEEKTMEIKKLKSDLANIQCEF
jgi:predicted RNase H-like nuclease (RuvC/YqgF family)